MSRLSNSTETMTGLSANESNNSFNNYRKNFPTSSSSETHKNSSDERNNLTSGDICRLNYSFAESPELDIDRNQSAQQRDKIHDGASESLTNSPLDSTVRNDTISQVDKIKINNSKNSKSTSNSAAGIINSFKSWTNSLVTHLSKQKGRNRRDRSSRNMDTPLNVEANTEVRGRISQIEDNTSNAFRANISDEEFARRMQIEELNNFGALHIMENNSSLPPYLLGNFQDANYNPNITVSSSNSMTVSPFQGAPYKFEFQSSDDER
ncbi:uncharacterized protein cubi_02966 [Cryptosporidium ubiquitum]|uniref:Uncharacterized protein n=1 Tax=Cryptosporidium ubiquitum TaxID=857276 RepID=A0A1J4MKS5_9CRYT|nr:uncharacterized protein cubi_02966 [Cryptosporidium ubiquitum]OII74833.1 hypothetical protein cubi_02966 [Cryptosporidium ubiquitum]